MARAILAQETAEVLLACVTLTHPSMEPARIVQNSERVVRLSGLFEPYPFEATLPADRETANPSASLVIDNVTREIARKVRELTGDPPMCMLEVILASQPDIVEMGPFEFTVLSADADVMQIALALGYEEDFLNQRVPAQTYNPSNSPGLPGW